MLPKAICQFLIASAVLLFLQACSTPGVNPARPESGVGYLDFFQTNDLQWSLSDLTSGRTQRIGVCKLSGSFIRIARAPGDYDFAIRLQRGDVDSTFPSESTNVQVRVTEAMVTPVRVTFTIIGTTPTLVTTGYEFAPGLSVYTSGSPMREVKEALNLPLWLVDAKAEPPAQFKPKKETTYYRKARFF